jgi:DNA-binding NarL/FixJ family response regulator
MSTHFSRLPCATHGPESLHSLKGCVACFPLTPSVPMPRIERKRASRKGRFGTLGRPRATDLTRREREVAQLLAAGHTHAEVSRRLNVTREAISSTVQRALDRIGATQSYELFLYVSEVRP